jgi:hypothetical protein
VNVDLRQPRLVDSTNYLAMRATGNTHSAAGLWQDQIPALLEYDPLMTPAYFALCRFFFTEPIDQQWRNEVMFRRIGTRLLAAVGVRFVVTDAPFEGDALLRQTVDVPVASDAFQRVGINYPVPEFKLYLYELKRPNVGNYSPTQVAPASNASAILGRLADPSTDVRRWSSPTRRCPVASLPRI